MEGRGEEGMKNEGAMDDGMKGDGEVTTAEGIVMCAH